MRGLDYQRHFQAFFVMKNFDQNLLMFYSEPLKLVNLADWVSVSRSTKQKSILPTYNPTKKTLRQPASQPASQPHQLAIQPA